MLYLEKLIGKYIITMNKNIKNIVKEKIKKTKLIKTEILIKINKSILQNNNVKNNIKLYSTLQLIKKNKKHEYLSRQHKICLITGKRGGSLKLFNFSRYIIKKLILENKLTNLKKHNW